MNGEKEELVSGLPMRVVDRLRSELGSPAERITRCLRTAVALIEQAEVDDRDLRLAESAAYNLREALDSVVQGKDAADGGLAAVMAAWQRCTVEPVPPNPDIAPAVADLMEALRRFDADRTGESQYARKLLTRLSDRAGIEHQRRRNDVVSEYADLRHQANGAVHTEFTLDDVTTLFARTVAWFVRLFIPPDDLVGAIRGLAAQPWHGQDQITELELLASNDHHLRLFFGEITDPAWLAPLHDAGFAQLPTPDRPWPPVASLVGGLGQIHPGRVADLLKRMFTDTKQLAKDKRAFPSHQLLIIAGQLAPAGYDLVVAIARQHGDHPGVRVLSVDVASQADPAAQVVLDVAEVVLNHFERYADHDNYNATTVLDRLQAGITDANINARARMLAGKLRGRFRSPVEKYIDLGGPPLTLVPGPHPEPQLLLAHHLADLLSKARELGIPTSEQLTWLEFVPDDVGGRLRSHVMAGADDVPVIDKIRHIAHRLVSPRPTAEDLALVIDIESVNPSLEELVVWKNALGTPSPAPTDADDRDPSDWVSAWRWSALLPEPVFADWREPIASVTARWGQPESSALTGPRTPDYEFGWVGSPYNAGQLAAMPVLDAATVVAGWRPDAGTSRARFGPLELARALEEAVGNDPANWSADPAAIVAALREPVYLEHYFRGLGRSIDGVLPYANVVLGAAAQARAAVATRDPAEDALAEAESDPKGVETAILDLIGMLASKDADIAENLEDLWEWSLSSVDNIPSTDEGLLYSKLGVLASAEGRLWGRSLTTVIRLAYWEFRRQGAIRPVFVQTLDAVLEKPGSVGREFRAILAHQRPLLEHICGPWLDRQIDVLFRDGALGQETFDLTLKTVVPTAWLYEHLTDELFRAALRGAGQATREIAIALLNEVDGYDHDIVIQQLRKDPAVLAATSEDVAFLVQQEEPGSARLALAVQFWTRLLDCDRAAVPAEALHRLGRWAFVTDLNDETWADLTARTLSITDGDINHAMSIADRVVAIPAGPTSRQILLSLLGKGETWERHHVAGKALDVLRESAAASVDDSFWRLRTRLIDLGHFDARDIHPDGQDDDG